MKLIPLSGKIAGGRCAVVDDDDFDKVAHLTWSVNTGGHVFRSHWDPVRKKQFSLLMHRFIVGLERGDLYEVDHENRDKLDNRRSNLRVVPPGVNQQNYAPREGCSSVHRGVSWNKHKSKWHAYGFSKGKLNHLGYFNDEEEASAVAAAWRKEHLPFSVD